MISINISFQSSDGGASLKGASFSIADAETGEVLFRMSGADHDVMLCDQDWADTEESTKEIASPNVMRGLVGNKTYVISETVAPSLTVETEGEDGNDVTAVQRYHAVSAKKFRVLDKTETQPLIIRHDPSGSLEFQLSGGSKHLSPKQGLSLAKALFKESGIRAVPAAASQLSSSMSAKVTRIKKILRRSGSISASEAAHIGIFSIVATVLLLVLGITVLAPLGLTFVLCMAGVPAEGFGGQWTMQCLSAYMRDYLFNGWTAYGMLSSAYPQLVPNPLLALIFGAVPTAALIWYVDSRLALLFEVKNEVLEGLPPAIKKGEANYGIYGSSQLINGRKDVGEVDGVTLVKSTAGGDATSGIYAGYYTASNGSQLYAAAANAVLDGVEDTVNKVRGSKDGEHSKEDDKWHVPAGMRPATPGWYAMLPAESHTAVFGDTGAGKTRRLLLTLIQLWARSLDESFIIFDPKGELYGYLSPFLRARGFQVYVVDMSDPLRSHCWNIMEQAAKAWKAGKKTTADQLIADVVDLIAPKSDKEGNAKYFNDGARSLIRSVMLYVISDPKCPEDQRTPATVARIIADYCAPQRIKGGGPKDVFVPYEVMLEMLGMDHVAYKAYSGARNAGEEYLRNFCSTAATFLSLFTSPSIESMSGYTECPMSKVANEPVALFLTIPANKTTYKPFALMFLQQAYSDLTEIAQQGTSESGAAMKLKQRVNFVCEEICSIPRWNGLANATNIARGYGIRFLLIIQNKSLFDALYEEESNAILGNCTTKLFLSTGDVEVTARYISSMLGTYTACSTSTSKSGSRFSPIKTQANEQVSAVKREVLNSDEILRWSANLGVIAFIKESSPILIPLPDVSQTPTQPLLGMGSEKDNLKLIYSSRLQRPQRETELGVRWLPELSKLKDGKKYEPEDRASARKSFMESLAKYAAENMGIGKDKGRPQGKGGSGNKGGASGKGRSGNSGSSVYQLDTRGNGKGAYQVDTQDAPKLIVATWDGTESQIWDQADSNLLLQLNRKPGLEVATFSDSASVERWISKKEAEANDEKMKRYIEGQGPNREGKNPFKTK